MQGWCGAANPPRGRAPFRLRIEPRAAYATRPRRMRDAPSPRGRVSAKKSAAERRAANPPRAERAYPPQNKAARLTNRRRFGIIRRTIVTRDELRPPLFWRGAESRGRRCKSAATLITVCRFRAASRVACRREVIALPFSVAEKARAAAHGRSLSFSRKGEGLLFLHRRFFV